MNNFYSLKVKEINKKADNSVSVTFDIPNELKNKFSFQAGQYITLQKEINGENIRRAYSIWKSPNENGISVLIKQIENGKFSTYANNSLTVANKVEVMPPSGNFKLLSSSSNKLTFFAAGSGITPIISMLKEELLKENNSTLTLFYVNKTKASVIFKKELTALETNYNNRFKIHYLYTREKAENTALEGRINKNKCIRLEENKLLNINQDAYYMCGPEEMILDIKEYLISKNIQSNNIHFELFKTSVSLKETITDAKITKAKVFLTIDDDDFEYEYEISKSDSLLDAGIEKGLDLPFSCKGGVCCTCRAKVIKGKAKMAINYALSDSEVEEGYILTCQAHPLTKKITVSFDD